MITFNLDLKNAFIQWGQFYASLEDCLVSMRQIPSVKPYVWHWNEGKLQTEPVIGAIFLYFKVQNHTNPFSGSLNSWLKEMVSPTLVLKISPLQFLPFFFLPWIWIEDFYQFNNHSDLNFTIEMKRKTWTRRQQEFFNMFTGKPMGFLSCPMNSQQILK